MLEHESLAQDRKNLSHLFRLSKGGDPNLLESMLFGKLKETMEIKNLKALIFEKRYISSRMRKWLCFPQSCK